MCGAHGTPPAGPGASRTASSSSTACSATSEHLDREQQKVKELLERLADPQEQPQRDC